jgi:hypothetical protein
MSGGKGQKNSMTNQYRHTINYVEAHACIIDSSQSLAQMACSWRSSGTKQKEASTLPMQRSDFGVFPSTFVNTKCRLRAGFILL